MSIRRSSSKVSLSWHVILCCLWTCFLSLQLLLFAPSHVYNNDSIETPNKSGGPVFIQSNGVGNLRTKENPTTGAVILRKNVDSSAATTATFNNIDVVFKQFNDDFHSQVDCVGRDLSNTPLYSNISWVFESCNFHHLCLDMNSTELFVVGDAKQLDVRPMALGAINPRWRTKGFDKGMHKVKWTPRIIYQKFLKHQGYYELPDNLVMLPFHSMAAHNVGHLLWDDFLSMFVLLTLFGYIEEGRMTNKQLLFLRQPATQKLYATCEMQRKKGKQCAANFEKFLPLLGVDPKTFSSIKNVNLVTKYNQQQQSNYVCARQATAGIGMLMDHGMRDHGWTLPQRNSTVGHVPHNLGRGGLFYSFRNFMLNNMGFPPQKTTSSSSLQEQQTKQRTITFSTHSSKGFERSLGFEKQISALSKSYSPNNVRIQNITMRDLSLNEQIQVALESSIFITVCGGGAMTASFLPKGSSLIVYYQEDGGFDFFAYNYTYTPARLDWDLLNNAPHLRVHWLPMKTMDTMEEIKSLELLIQHEFQVMSTFN